MKHVFINVINRGGYNLADLLRRIDGFYVEGKLTEEERTELYTLARERANYEDSANVFDKLIELENRIRILENKEGTNTDPGEVPAALDYQAGKWYYAGDRVTFEDAVYICSAPDGQVCTWSPTEYPAYWTKEV